MTNEVRIRKPMTRYLLKQLVNSTIEDVSLRENVGYDAVVGALNRQIDTTGGLGTD